MRMQASEFGTGLSTRKESVAMSVQHKSHHGGRTGNPENDKGKSLAALAL
jgi:hypothetical protein